MKITSPRSVDPSPHGHVPPALLARRLAVKPLITHRFPFAEAEAAYGLILERRVRGILDGAGPGRHVFNLGHGILPPTDPENAVALVEMVHRLGQRAAS